MEHYESVYALLRTALWGPERFPLSADPETDWAGASKELADHTVDGLAVDTLALLPGVDPALRQAWIMKSTRKMQFWHKLMGEQDALCCRLREAGIAFAVLKGAAAAVCYPKPEYRTMGDIDLIVKPEEFDRAAALIQGSGWTVAGDSARHMELKKDGVMLELHRYFATSGNAAAAKILDEQILEALGRTEDRVLEQYRFAMLPRLENGLVLLAHIAQHLRDGLGLRQIIDWMLFVDRELDDGRWESQFGHWARITGMEVLAVTVTRMCQLYLGLREDGISWCMDAEGSLCRELMELTMARGNFGRKQGDYATMVNVLGRFSAWKTLPRGLQMRGEYNWKALKKHPWLRPFAWLYQICRYIRRGFARKDPFRKLGKDVRQVRQENRLWEKLEVTRPREAARQPLDTEKEDG